MAEWIKASLVFFGILAVCIGVALGLAAVSRQFGDATALTLFGAIVALGAPTAFYVLLH